MKKVFVILSAVLMLTMLAVGVSFSASAETSCLEEHTWDKGVVTTKPTHMETGVKTFTCTECGATKTEIVDKTTAHKFAQWVICDDKQHQAECECGKVIVSNHMFNMGVVTKQPTHYDTGVMTYTCTSCGFEVTEVMDTVDYHVYTHKYIHLDGDMHAAVCVCGDSVEERHDLVLLEDVILYRCTECGFMPPTWDEMRASSADGANTENAGPIWLQKITGVFGCNSVVSIGTGLSLILAIGAAGVLFKKKED